MTTTEPEVEMRASEQSAQAAEIADATPDPVGVVHVEHSTEVVPMPAPSPMADLSTIPAVSELQTLAQLATTFAHSELVPKTLQGKPEDCLLVLLTARDLGLSVTVAFRECHPIDGRVTVSPKLKLAIVRQRGLGRVWPDPDNDLAHQTWSAARADDPATVYSVRYSWQDAQRAGLVMGGCTAEEHSEQCRKGWAYGASRDQRAKACKLNWRTYPGQMLQWRAMGYLMDQAFGEVGVGLYGADELGAVTDDDGRVIDVMEVPPLDGMPDHRPAPKEPGTDPNDVAPEELRDRFRERIYRLPHPAIETMKEQWARRQQDDQPMIFPLPVLPVRQVKSAEALISRFEGLAEKGEWGPWDPPPLSWVAPPLDPAPPETATAPVLGGVDGPAEPSEAPSLPGIDTEPPSAPPYDAKHPPSDVLEAAIDRARAIPAGKLDDALVECGQTLVKASNADTKRRRLVQAWLTAGWLPEETPKGG